MRESFSRFSLNDRAIPFVLLLITVVSFGLLIPWLGFYWDDWPVIYMTNTQGTAGFWGFYQYDRPFSAWTYILFAPLLGTYPLTWQIFVLLLRWLTAVFVWMSLKMIWPQKPRQVFWIALLFAVCPIFPQQPVAVAYSQHWLSYLFFFCSIYFMLRALDNRRYFLLFTALAVFTSFMQLFTMEYFIGLELLRPIILWLYFRERESETFAKLLFKRVIGSVWIYAVLLLAYVIWRIFFIRLAGTDPNSPVFLGKLLTTPLDALLEFAQKTAQDFVYLIASWLVAVKPANLDLHRSFSIIALAIAIIITALFGMVINRYQPAAQHAGEDRWHIYAMAFGVLAILLGMLPVWVIDRQVSIGPLGPRFSLAAMFGISILFIGFLEWLSPRTTAKLTVICILLGIAIHTNLYAARAFQRSWNKQRTFYWQLIWRAPYIEPGTAFISNGEIFSYVGLYSTSMGISLIYPPAENPTEVPYWFFSYWERLYRYQKEMVSGTVLTGGLRNYSFHGDSKNTLLLDFSPEQNRCLHFSSLRDGEDKDWPGAMRWLIGLSNLTRIKEDPPSNWKVPTSILGPEPKHTWCYYFEKAELASQVEDWPGVIDLMQEAKDQGFAPMDMREFMPLLDAYLQTGDNAKALSLSLQMSHLSKNIGDRVCNAWLNVSNAHSDAAFLNAFKKVRERSSCFD